MKKNIVGFPDRSAIEEEAGAWLIKLDGDDTPTAEDLASLREWVQRSPAHAEELGNLASFWGKMNVLTELAVPLGSPEGQKRRLFLGVPKALLSVGRPTRLGRVAVAATIVFIGVALSYGVWLRSDPYLAGNGFYATAVGQQQTTTLADGSVVWLNTNSQIKVEYGHQYRNIRLTQGEVYFTAAKDAERPFRVYAENRRVQAVGTAFSVYLKDNGVNITVTEGSVVVESFNRSKANEFMQKTMLPDAGHSSGSGAAFDDGYFEALGTLKAGQSATIRSDLDVAAGHTSALEVIQSIEAKKMERLLSWREGFLMFAGDPLEEVVDEISRYTNVSIEISDPAVRAIRIGGRFPVGETEAMFDALETNFGLRVTRLSHDHVLLSAPTE